MAKAYGERPSNLLRLTDLVDDPALALDFDTAVTLFGQYVEAKLSERDDKGKPVNTLGGILGVSDAPPALRKFRDPNTGKIIEA